MARKCHVCVHPRRDLIDLALVAMTPRPTLAQRFGVSQDSIDRHAARHLPPQVRAALLTQLAPSAVDLEALQKSESESLLASLISQRARLSMMAAAALEHDLPAIAIRVESAITNNLELTGKLLGTLVSRSEITTRSFLVTPDYLRFRSILIEELRGTPELAARIAARIAAIETDAAEAITAKAAKPPLTIEHQPHQPENIHA
jgi:hypothetical protein